MTTSNIKIQKLAQEHLPACYTLIEELAIYEKAPNEVTLTLKQFQQDFVDKRYDAWVAIKNDDLVGMALYFYAYSTWKGKTMHLEDLIVKQSERRQGIGHLLVDQLIGTAQTEGVHRLTWQVLDWNESAIEFYKKYPATFDGEWINVKLTKEALDKI